jgi:hypothetical protein
MPYSPKRIKMQVFPGDSLEVSRGVQSLISIGAVELFDSEFGPVLHVSKWSKHQKVSNPSKSKYSSINLTPLDGKPRKQAVPEQETLELSVNSTEDSRELRKERERERGVNKDLSSKPDEFDQWYSRYPKKEAKEAARKAFIKARKTVDLKALIEGVDRYVEATKDKDRQFLALPATWLNAGRWADEISETPGQPGWTLGLDQ